jgi:hypothetical protein
MSLNSLRPLTGVTGIGEAREYRERGRDASDAFIGGEVIATFQSA